MRDENSKRVTLVGADVHRALGFVEGLASAEASPRRPSIDMTDDFVTLLIDAAYAAGKRGVSAGEVIGVLQNLRPGRPEVEVPIYNPRPGLA